MQTRQTSQNWDVRRSASTLERLWNKFALIFFRMKVSELNAAILELQFDLCHTEVLVRHCPLGTVSLRYLKFNTKQ